MGTEIIHALPQQYLQAGGQSRCHVGGDKAGITVDAHVDIAGGIGVSNRHCPWRSEAVGQISKFDRQFFKSEIVRAGNVVDDNVEKAVMSFSSYLKLSGKLLDWVLPVWVGLRRYFLYSANCVRDNSRVAKRQKHRYGPRQKPNRFL